jgi:hypothetical protein
VVDRRLSSSIDPSQFVVTPSGSNREIVNMSGRESTPYDVLRSSSLQCRETYNAGAVEHVN